MAHVKPANRAKHVQSALSERTEYKRPQWRSGFTWREREYLPAQEVRVHYTEPQSTTRTKQSMMVRMMTHR